MQHERGIWSCKRPQSAVHTTWSLQKQIGKPGQSRSIIIFCSYFRQNVFTAIIWPLTEWDHFLAVCAFQHFIFPPSVSFILKSSFFSPSFSFPPPRLFFYLFLFSLFVDPHPNSYSHPQTVFIRKSEYWERTIPVVSNPPCFSAAASGAQGSAINEQVVALWQIHLPPTASRKLKPITGFIGKAYCVYVPSLFQLPGCKLACLAVPNACSFVVCPMISGRIRLIEALGLLARSGPILFTADSSDIQSVFQLS